MFEVIYWGMLVPSVHVRQWKAAQDEPWVLLLSKIPPYVGFL